MSERAFARLSGMKLSEWARRNGVHYQTAYRWFRSGVLPVPARKLPTGTILVEHRDRLARFGVEQLQAALAAHGRRILVADPSETSDDLVRDMVEVLTSFCARLYGRRGGRNRALRAVTCAKRNPAARPDLGSDLDPAGSAGVAG